jgi:hypothetical protein
MLALFISSLLFLYISINFGIFISKKFDIGSLSTDVILLGVLFINSIVTLLSILIPVNFYLFLILLLISIIYTYLNKKTFFEFCCNIIEPKSNKSFFFLASIIALYFSSTSPSNFDTNFYHIQSIKWIEEYKIIPGLANLHGRFGFNSNIFTLFALTTFKPLFQQELFVVNYLLFFIIISFFINKSFSSFHKERLTQIFLVYFISSIFLFLNISNLSSASPDYASFIITYYILIRAFEFSITDEKKETKSIIPLVILCFYVLTIKLSTLPIILLAVILIIRYKLSKKDWVKLLLFISLIIIPWLVRNIILSGWIVYPFSAFDLFNFDWKVPKHLVDIENQTVIGWARVEDRSIFLDVAKMKFLNWFPIWFHQLSKLRFFVLCLSFVFPIFYFLFFMKKRNNIILTSLIFTSTIGLFFWLLMAPDIRFGLSFIFFSAISPLFYISFSLNINRFFNGFKLSIFGLLFLILFKNLREFKNLKNNYYTGLLIPPKTLQPSGLMFLKYKLGGYQVYYPNIGVQCYDHILPCAAFLNKNVLLRSEKIEDGFKYIK